MARLHVSQLFRWPKELCKQAEATKSAVRAGRDWVLCAADGRWPNAVDDDTAASTQEPQYHRDCRHLAPN